MLSEDKIQIMCHIMTDNPHQLIMKNDWTNSTQTNLSLYRLSNSACVTMNFKSDWTNSTQTHTK